jgi:hypothetical protein
VDNELLPLPWQADALASPRQYDMAMLAARGGGKTHFCMLYAIRDVQEFGPDARLLFLRYDHTGGSDFITKCLLNFPLAFGPRGFSFNSQSGVFKFHNGASLEVNQMANVSEYAKMQGREFSVVFVEEAQHWATPEPIDLTRSNLRPSAGVPARMILTANAGGPGHSWLLKRYYGKAPAWEPFVEASSQREWIWIPSSFRDNDRIDRLEYERQLVAACPHDPARLKGWRDNDWFAVLAGAFFADAIDVTRNLVPAWDAVPVTHGERWPVWIAHDYGVAAPSVTLLMCESPGDEVNGRYFPRGSIVILDEFASNEPGSLTRGMGYGIARLSDEIIALCERWDVRPDGCADDACFAKGGHAAGSVADEFRQQGVYFWPARKADRLGGWTRMRRLLAAAGSLDEAGLYVSELARGWWETVPSLPRDPRRPEDLDSRGPDHWADATRYGILHLKRVASSRPMWGRDDALFPM